MTDIIINDKQTLWCDLVDTYSDEVGDIQIYFRQRHTITNDVQTVSMIGMSRAMAEKFHKQLGRSLEKEQS